MSRFLIALVIFLIIGVAFLSVGIVLNYYFDTLVESRLEKKLNLLNNTEAFNNWVKPPVPIYMSYNFFNITNYEEFSKGAKPIVEQVGPYVYREIREKVGIEYSSDNESVSYKEQKFYIFDSSNGLNESDAIYTLNIPILTVSKLLEEKLPKFILEIIGVVLNGEMLIEKRMISELLWGFNMSLADDINKKLNDFHLPPIHFPIFGLYVNNNCNGSLYNEYNISTGVSNIREVGYINSWRGQSNLTYWSDGKCNMINGTDGTILSPLLNESQILYFFSPDICRSTYMTYDAKIKIFDLNSFKFSVPESVFKDPRVEVSNRCFCVPNYPNCMKAGVLDISRCNEGAPVAISLPHFLYGDEEYVRAVGGMSPNLTLHQSYMNVEPISGLVLEVHKRLQINFILDRYTTFKSTWFIKEPIIFPVMWAEENAVIDEPTAARVYRLIYGPILAGHILLYASMTVGALILLGIILAVMVALWRRLHKPATTPTGGKDGRATPTESTYLLSTSVDD